MQLIQQGEAVHAPHPYVRQRDGDVVGGETLKRLFCACYCDHTVTGIFQKARQDSAHQVFVFGYQN